jgi:hypothetical protein
MKNSTIKKMLSAVCFIALTCVCYAQDIIVTKDSRRINAIVTEVNVDHIRFKMYDNQDGPVYGLPKSDIVTIIYRNGRVETFAPESSTQPQTARATTRTSTQTPSATTRMSPTTTQISDSNWGVKGGINVASEMAGENSTDSRLGIHLGGFMEKAISNGVDFQPELLYSMQGATTNVGSKTYTDKLDYITVPLMFKIYVNKNRRFSIDVGPQFGYMVSAKVSDGSSSKSIYDYSGLQKFDASLCLGVSYKLNNNLDLVFRGTGGLTKIIESQEHKNSVGQLGVGYRF